MKTIHSLLVCIVIFGACSKKTDVLNTNSTNNPTNPTTTFVDTIAAGWTKMYLPSQYNMDVCFTDDLTGYIAGSANFFKTTDGGATWSSIAPITNDVFYNISSTPNGKIFMLSRNPTPVLASSDGCASFDSIHLTGSHVARDAFFITDDIGYIIGKSELFKTTDAGITWTKSLPTGLNYTQQYTSSLFFLDNTTGWIVNGHFVYRSNGSADAWLAATFNTAPTQDFSAVYATNTNTVYAVTRGGEIYKSINGGANFSLLTILPGKDDYADIIFIDNYTGYACHANKIYKTTDAGSSWQNVVTISTDIWELQFNDLGHGWAVGDSGVVLTYHQ
ncbi:MAG: YCF48-related protein [Ferruginibacter sp.]